MYELKKDALMGCIIGDIVGSRFEIDNNKYGREFELFNVRCRFTDDSLMCLAVAKALCECNDDYSDIEDKCIKYMVSLGRKYSYCGFGKRFYNWVMSDNHEPYGSFANGSAMRISPVGVIFDNIDDIKRVSNIITNVSHNHIDSINGSQVVSICVRMALDNKSKEEIKEYIESNYFKIDDLDNERKFRINCVETVKQSLDAFFRSNDYEDAIRNAIELGGDSDTIAAITGSIAGAYYGVPYKYIESAFEYLDKELIDIYNEFDSKYQGKNIRKLKK